MEISQQRNLPLQDRRLMLMLLEESVQVSLGPPLSLSRIYLEGTDLIRYDLSKNQLQRAIPLQEQSELVLLMLPLAVKRRISQVTSLTGLRVGEIPPIWRM